MSETGDQAKHDVQRGEIVRALVGYGRAWMTFKTLYYVMDDMGQAMSDDALTFHLVYLQEAGLVELKRRRDLPGFRTDRPHREGSPDDIMQLGITNKGVQLYDKKIGEDPGVKF